jgi:hypothetical protein
MPRGGRRPGAGQKKGNKHKATIEKERVLTEYRNKIMKHADILFRNQMHLAQGVSYLYKWVKGKQKPVLVVDEKEIEQYVLKEMGGHVSKKDMIDKKATYYFISTERPDNKAIDSMLDRTFGKATQVIGGDKDNPLIVEGVEISVRKK